MLINKNSFAKPLGKAMLGDTGTYPGAFITFKINIELVNTDRKSVMVKRKRSFVADSAATTRLTMNPSSAGLEQGDGDSAEIDPKLVTAELYI